MGLKRWKKKSWGMGMLMIGLVLLPGLASMLQQRLLQKKILTLDWAQAAVNAGHGNSKYAELTFSTLKNWTYVEGKTPLPTFIKDLDGKDVEMVGFMMPLTEVKDITEFLLVPSLWGCCYGQPPAVNHIVVVKMPNGHLTKFFNDAIRVRGRFSCGESKQDGYLVSLYVLTADQIETAQ